MILNNQLKTIKDDTIEFFFNLLKLKLRFIDIDEHDSLIVSNYVLTNLYLLHLLEDMENKSSILSSNFNMNYINEFSNIIDDEIYSNAITGSTGAGIIPSDSTHYSWRNNNISWYKPFEHHQPLLKGQSFFLSAQRIFHLIFFLG